jgi:hypothetical protein
MSTLTESTATFLDALVASERWHEIPEAADIYGRFVGSWNIDVFDYAADGTVHNSTGEVHFARVLEGRAVQLVWSIPRREDRSAALPQARNRYGTTLNVWNPELGAWRVTWINPVTGARNELVGRSIGSEIVQIGTHADGRPVRWSFTQIAQHSFRWTGEVLNADGQTWTLQMEFRARRRA